MSRLVCADRDIVDGVLFIGINDEPSFTFMEVTTQKGYKKEQVFTQSFFQPTVSTENN